MSASDGDVGSVRDFYFDDALWTLRYLVVDAGRFFGRHVLISPIAFREADWSTGRFHVALTQEKVKNSPSVDLDKPVSRQYERDYNSYYGWPYYWGFGGIWGWGIGPYPGALAESAWREPQEHKDARGDAHLRSAREVTGYHIQGSDEEIGHIADFIVDDETWAIRYLVVDTRNWWFGKKVLVAPEWADRISWTERKVYINLPRETIKKSPPWSADEPINRDYEGRLYDYYGRPAYWLLGPDEVRRQEAKRDTLAQNHRSA